MRDITARPMLADAAMMTPVMLAIAALLEQVSGGKDRHPPVRV